jgi:hypothetical protein|uniref:Uncharacterized protein n=1 Tax=Micromonas pusilla TaxID=38833 RepID=A0A7S0DDM0_MICPS|mmetsp:Transcript_807/g.3345  ORF Transcript_807/g.3345 Transcript_807/m.3345 type:complete len:399 (+) Transcript_807:186-1382(+)
MPPAMHHLVVAPRAIAPGAPRPRRARGGFGTGALSRPAPRPRLVRVASADDEPNATWDAESEQTGLSAQLRTTNALREKLSRALFDVDPSLVDEDVVYTSQVHEARGKRAYDELMREWKPLVKRNLQSFTYDAERAFCPEPGVLLVRWRAEWDGAFNADAAMVTFIEENFPEYDPTELARLRAEVEGADRAFSGDREYDVRGITTVRVNREGKVVMHSDRIVEKGEYLPGASESWSSSDEADGTLNDEKEEEDEVAARDEFATTVFYNALKPPGVTALRWFFDVLLELEWQYFRKQVGDDTTVISGKDEFVKTITTLLITAVVLPSFIISYAVLVSLTSPGGLLSGGGDEYDALIQQADAQDRLEAVKNGGTGSLPAAQAPSLDADLLRSLWGAKIGL